MHILRTRLDSRLSSVSDFAPQRKTKAFFCDTILLIQCYISKCFNFFKFISQFLFPFHIGDCCGTSDYNYCSECECKYDEWEILGVPDTIEEEDSDLSAGCNFFRYVVGDG